MTSHTLLRNMSLVHVGCRPHDLGVMVIQPNGRAYRPEWRLVSDLQVQLDNPGPPEFWCSDRHRVYFDKPADRDYEIQVSQEQHMPTRMKHEEHGWTHAYGETEVEALKAHGWEVEQESKPLVLPVVEEPPKRKPGRPAKAK